MKFFDNHTFPIYRSVPQRNFSALWHKKFSTESRDIPFFCISFFDSWHLKLSETLDFFSRSFSLLWDKKIEGKPWYTKKFPRSKTFWILEVVPRKFFEIVVHSQPKNFRRKIVIFRSYSIFFYTSRLKLWNIRWFLTKFFGTVRQKNRRKTVIRMKVSEIPNILNLRSRSPEFFALCETKNFEGRTWFSVYHKRSAIEKFHA